MNGAAAAAAAAITNKPVDSVAAVTSGTRVVREFMQDGRRFFPLGGQKNNVFLVPDVFRREVRVNIREYYPAREEEE